MSLLPSCDREEYVFVTVERLPDGVEPVATVAEPEGLTAVVRRDDADRLGLEYEFVAARIVLEALTGLDEVGVTAAVAGALAELGIGCNVFAGIHHDHLFVPYDRAAEAVAAVAGLPWPVRD
jgi:hypothetical protein